MPPIRSESQQKSANQEGKILLALDDIKNGRIKSLRAAAKLYEIPPATLHHRARGRLPRVDQRPPSYKLTDLEENSLNEWIISIDTRRAAPRPTTIAEIANILLTTRGTNPSPTIGKN
ncbi:HTH Psq-type DNA-binding domain-containing protein [Penicillium ucsense]|uniref:HTH Psq-type DNA-binding domain-containing protein n=1 Tax=Penicillium ucsense TaxID=2839758 RepID=A0A8J8VVM8_9EURO|nr:HTH Psq-type DNA-binding domain-containing protein [Penicillium ucsense]